MKRIGILFFIVLCLFSVTTVFSQLSWTSLTLLPSDRHMAGIAATQEYPYYLYVIGGDSWNPIPQDQADANGDVLSVWVATIYPRTGEIGGWRLAGILPNEDAGFNNFAYIENSCVCYKGYLYIAGGNTNSSENNRTVVTFAKINDDGSLASWQTKSFSPPGDGESMNVALACNDKFYIIGGGTNSGTNSAKCYYAAINPDGSLGDFAEDTDSPMPQGMYFHRGVALDGYIYIIGGYTGSAQSTVYSVKINVDGSLGTWTTQTPLPAARHDGAAWVKGGKIYYGGGTEYVATVYVATPSAGVISGWSTDTPLPVGRRRGGAATVGGSTNVYLASWRSPDAAEKFVYGDIDQLPSGRVKWAQPPNMVDGYDVPSWFHDPINMVVADDWSCTTGQPIVHIRWWGSYPGWEETNPGFVMPPVPPNHPSAFRLSWHEYRPGPPYSQPGPLIREELCTVYTEKWYGAVPKWNFPGTYEHEFVYDQDLFTSWTQELGQKYFLDIQAMYPLAPSNPWGWKNTEFQWNDDAVLSSNGGVNWNELVWPLTHRLELKSMDMAFELWELPTPTPTPTPTPSGVKEWKLIEH